MSLLLLPQDATHSTAEIPGSALCVQRSSQDVWRMGSFYRRDTSAPMLLGKARYLCLFLILCFHLALGGVPGPCRHSVTQEHLRSLNRLIDNQLDRGCFIIYPFTEHMNLSQICYIKAALPHVLELLRTHFRYIGNSDNRRYVNTLEKAIYHLYSQGCVSEINEEIEDRPSRLIRMTKSSPKEALKKARHVIQTYMSLMTVSTRPVDWNCQAEYSAAEDNLTPAPVAVTSSTGEPDGGHTECSSCALPGAALPRQPRRKADESGFTRY
ncbi:uncharacterized protein LOC129186275 [Dunckerocampus dactyliophorus]|uniref:uncharacterized protein LOC129186275 n=1 Tax=Dunckerocampus dactyliophorus TaxID=161453 RepID=UPI0024053A80|nr:uncharacterized protein LOC129186275 [Dunckerocampus dactyliophorus]